jgi:hypothetical protein
MTERRVAGLAARGSRSNLIEAVNVAAPFLYDN